MNARPPVFLTEEDAEILARFTYRRATTGVQGDAAIRRWGRAYVHPHWRDVEVMRERDQRDR